MTRLSGELPQGRTTIEIHVALPEPDTWAVTLLSGSEELTTGSMPAPRGMTPFQGIDVGADRRSPVSWDLYKRHGTFPFTGTLHTVRYEPAARSRDALEALIREAIAVGAALE